MKKGRQKLDKTESRHNQLTLSLSNAELALLKARAFESKSRLSIYIREAALNSAPKIVPEFNQKAWIELSKSAANLNQIARHLNESSKANDEITINDLRKVQLALLDFRSSLIN